MLIKKAIFTGNSKSSKYFQEACQNVVALTDVCTRQYKSDTFNTLLALTDRYSGVSPKPLQDFVLEQSQAPQPIQDVPSNALPGNALAPEDDGKDQSRIIMRARVITNSKLF